jgi:predicted transcriptional regulator
MRRSNLAIMRDILEAAEDSHVKTYLVHAIGINSQLFNIHTKPLLDGGFLKKSDNVFKTTPKGHHLALKISDFLISFDIDPHGIVLHPNGEQLKDSISS